MGIDQRCFQFRIKNCDDAKIQQDESEKNDLYARIIHDIETRPGKPSGIIPGLIERIPPVFKRRINFDGTSKFDVASRIGNLDRAAEFLYLRFQIEPETDILIVKNDKITDTSYANITFWDGNSWLTPARRISPRTSRTHWALFQQRIRPGRSQC